MLLLLTLFKLQNLEAAAADLNFRHRASHHHHLQTARREFKTEVEYHLRSPCFSTKYLTFFFSFGESSLGKSFSNCYHII